MEESLQEMAQVRREQASQSKSMFLLRRSAMNCAHRCTHHWQSAANQRALKGGSSGHGAMNNLQSVAENYQRHLLDFSKIIGTAKD
ncbi:hypothetical protein KCP69_11615 [Salmonella enterica subsp. enterica]|nr:hypothetical protein KCP69_11615 [Salmonella enterica subsp. enterica]